ncbi:energy-coupling factor transporter transmembrane component T family protein [Fictibacillus barbaricus]|uniref:Energy-coupling factor transport system permease protein n=1 Tax=Fictibacillus barbaricus TaxID=182136 RepID=A0ABU1TYU9_9BACL|nr:energy-coupling factor transporter transmembrane component T [Fictibacillus barbaricus]MDR7072384.1 energy-coupling factor transport system permease protein [Fictibacillus barbaricus]
MQELLTQQESWLHKINPSFKLIILTLLFIFGILIHNVNFMISFTIVMSILFLFFTGHSYKRVFLFSLPFMIIFVSTSSSMIFFGEGKTLIFQWGLIHITEESLYRGIHLGFRALSFAMLGLTFALTTRPVYLFYSLMQQLHLKPKYAYSFMAAVRLLPIMIEEFQTIRYAQKVRGVNSSNGLFGYFKMIKSLMIPLLSQSIRRAFRIAVAMEAKRFNNDSKRTYFYQIGFSKFDLLFLIYFVICIGLAYFAAIEYPLFPSTDVRQL